MKPLVFASGNAHKAREMSEVLKPLGIEIVLQSTFNVQEVAETASTFIENALIKARHASLQTGLPALADDSGLQVMALNGAPGIFSARYAGEKVSDQAHICKLLHALTQSQSQDRRARFYCALVYVTGPDDATPIIAEGSWPGEILTESQGEGGFGYDPIFYVPTHQCSAAQLPPDIKNALSHRGQALSQLLEKLKKEGIG